MKSLLMRRFSGNKSSSIRNAQAPQSPPVSFSPPLNTTGSGSNNMNTGTGSLHGANNSRPVSASTNASYDLANRPLSQAVPMTQHSSMPTAQHSLSSLSRTDLIVLKHFWDGKYQENAARDLHFLKFPFFPQYPEHKDLLPYCEIYHLVKTQPGAKIISLGTGSANGVYIGFELFEGSQLHIDMDDEWHGITHYRVGFKPFEKMVSESDATFKSWQKPVTIEFLEEMYQKWSMDLMSICWEGKEVRELGGGGSASGSANL